MSKKTKINGHVAHKLTVGDHRLFYIVAPERESVEVYADWRQPPVAYVQVDRIHITPRMLGIHGYLQSVLKRLVEYLSGDYAVAYCQNDVSVTEEAFKSISKEEKKMHKTNTAISNLKTSKEEKENA